jgi:hypothetical protein
VPVGAVLVLERAEVVPEQEPGAVVPEGEALGPAQVEAAQVQAQEVQEAAPPLRN